MQLQDIGDNMFPRHVVSIVLLVGARWSPQNVDINMLGGQVESTAFWGNPVLHMEVICSPSTGSVKGRRPPDG